jgi:peroxiredoxin
MKEGVMKGDRVDRNDERDLGRWVDDRLAGRIPDDGWQPNVLRGLAQFRERQTLNGSRRRSLLWVAVGTAAACLPLMALPVTRAFAQNCVSACVSQSGKLREFFTGRETTSGPSIVFATPETRRRAPDFTLDDASGNPIRLSEFRGRVVLLSFWATWCVPCNTELPWFMKFQETYKDRGLAVLGVSLDDDGWKSVKPYIGGMKVNYPVMIASGDIVSRYGGLASLPVTLIIDKSGRIAVTHIGLCPKNEYEAAINAMLAE